MQFAAQAQLLLEPENMSSKKTVRREFCCPRCQAVFFASVRRTYQIACCLRCGQTSQAASRHEGYSTFGENGKPWIVGARIKAPETARPSIEVRG